MAVTVKTIKQLDSVTDVPSNADLIINTSAGDTKRASVENFADSINTTFTGTQAEWNELTTAEKAKYIIVNITDDTSGGGGSTGNGMSIKYAVMTNGPDDQIKYAYTHNQDFEYEIGNAIFCYMGYSNTEKNPLLSVDSGPALPIYTTGGESPDLFWSGADVCIFYYDDMNRFFLVAMSSLVNLFSKSLTDIYATGATNNSGQTINAGDFFYRNRVLCVALAEISTNENLTENTNYIAIPDGALNYLKNMVSDLQEQTTSLATGLTNIFIPSTTNNTGSTISSGTFFYLKGELVQATSNISNNATITKGTNCIAVTDGGLNALNKTISNTSDKYSSSSSYKVGDLVIYNNTLYRCTTACSAASWAANKNNFTQTTLTNAVDSLNAALTQRLGTDIPYVYYGGLWYCRKNGICTVGITGLAVSGTYQLPNGMKPPYESACYGRSPANAYFTITTDGIVHYTASASNTLYGVLSYAAADAF